MNTSTFLACAVLVAVASANAQMPPNTAMPKTASFPGSDANVMTDGVVQNVDRWHGVVMLKHGDITNMAMPAMTMAFNVVDRKMLDKVKTGDRVRFHVEKVNGAPTVTRIDPAR